MTLDYERGSHLCRAKIIYDAFANRPPMTIDQVHELLKRQGLTHHHRTTRRSVGSLERAGWLRVVTSPTDAERFTQATPESVVAENLSLVIAGLNVAANLGRDDLREKYAAIAAQLKHINGEATP